MAAVKCKTCNHIWETLGLGPRGFAQLICPKCHTFWRLKWCKGFVIKPALENFDDYKEEAKETSSSEVLGEAHVHV